MEINLLPGAHVKKRMGVDRQQYVADGNLAVISISHKDCLLDCPLYHIIKPLWLFLMHRDVLWTNRYHCGLVFLEARSRNKREDPLFGLHPTRLGITSQLDHLPLDEIGETQEGRRELSLRPGIKLVRRTDLDQFPRMHHSNLIGNRQGFGLVVGDKNSRD